MIAFEIIRRECIDANIAFGKAMVLGVWETMITLGNMRRQ